MSNTLTRGKGRKNQPTPEFNNGTVSITQGQQPNGSMVSAGPEFGLPHVQIQGRAPAPESYATQHQFNTPIMNLNPATKVVQNMTSAQNIYQQAQGYQITAMSYSAPPPQYPHYSIPQSYFNQGFTGYPQQGQQQYYPSQPTYQTAPPSNIMQQAQSAVQTQSIEQPVAAPPKPREKKILIFVDPTTQEKVDMESELKMKKTEPMASAQEEAPAAANDRAVHVRQEFAKNLRAQIERRDSEKRKSECEPYREVPYAAPIAELPPMIETTPAPVVEEPVIVKETTPHSEPEKEPTPVVEEPMEVELSVSVAETQPAAPVVELPTTVETSIVEIKEVTKDEEQIQVAEKVIDETLGEDVKQIEQTEQVSVDIPSGPTTSIVEEIVHEVPEETEPEKTEEEKEAEEIEKKKLREIELDTLKGKLEEEFKDDINIMVYDRSFLNCIRDIEKEFKRTACPLTDAALKGYGIDRASMPIGREGKSKPDFNPSWVKQKNHGPKAYAGRSSFPADRGGHSRHPRKPTGPRPSIERQIERAVSLHKAEKAWITGVKKNVELPEDEAKKALLLKNVRSLFNKITPTTQNDLTQEFLKYEVSSGQEALLAVIDIIFDKAVEEPKFCPLYAEVCKAQVNVELQKQHQKSPFRDAILTRAQKTFVNRTQEREREEKVKAIENEKDEKKQLQLKIELAEQDSKFRRRKFGNITFIGQLFCQMLLSTRVINWCLLDLLKPTSEDAPTPMSEEIEESISCAVQLFESIGKMLESTKGNECDGYLVHLDRLKDKVSNRIKFMILNLSELRKNGWRPRKVVEQGPKRIDEIHNEIKQELIENQQARDKYDRSQGIRSSGGMGPRDGGMKKAQIIGRNSADNRMRGGEKDRRAKAAASANLASSTNLPPKTTLSKIDSGTTSSLGKKSNWSGGSAGGGGGTEPSGPQPIKNAWVSGTKTSAGSREGSEQRKMSGVVNERQQAMASSREAGKQIAGGPQRSDSQTSLSAQDSQINEETRERRKEEIEKSERKLMNTINSDIEEYSAGDATLQEVSSSIYDYVGKERYGSLPVRNVFKAFAQCAVEKMKPDVRLKAAYVLAHCLTNPDKRVTALQGFADYCSWVVDIEAWQDFPAVWNNLAEVIANAIQCDLSVYEGPRPNFDDFKASYLAAAQDTRKNYELLALVLKFTAEICYKRDAKDSETIISMMYEEIKCVGTFDKMKWEQALKAIPSPVPNHENMYALLTGSS